MKIRSVVAELFRADGRMGGQTRRSLQLLFAILRTRLQTVINILFFKDNSATEFRNSL